MPRWFGQLTSSPSYNDSLVHHRRRLGSASPGFLLSAGFLYLTALWNRAMVCILAQTGSLFNNDPDNISSYHQSSKASEQVFTVFPPYCLWYFLELRCVCVLNPKAIAVIFVFLFVISLFLFGLFLFFLFFWNNFLFIYISASKPAQCSHQSTGASSKYYFAQHRLCAWIRCNCLNVADSCAWMFVDLDHSYCLFTLYDCKCIFTQVTVYTGSSLALEVLRSLSSLTCTHSSVFWFVCAIFYNDLVLWLTCHSKSILLVLISFHKLAYFSMIWNKKFFFNF